MNEMEIMELLRKQGWLVVLKCIPELAEWFVESMPGKFELSKIQPWVCEAQWVGVGFKHDQYSHAKTAREAVILLFAKINDDIRNHPLPKRIAAKNAKKAGSLLRK